MVYTVNRLRASCSSTQIEMCIRDRNCWAHARRKFIDAQNFDDAKASEVLVQIQLLYAVERYCSENNYTPDEIKSHRQLHSIPVLETLHQTLQTQLLTSLPKSPIGMALQYTLARWDKLNAVSYTHLDVYKRQLLTTAPVSILFSNGKRICFETMPPVEYIIQLMS